MPFCQSDSPISHVVFIKAMFLSRRQSLDNGSKRTIFAKLWLMGSFFASKCRVSKQTQLRASFVNVSWKNNRFVFRQGRYRCNNTTELCQKVHAFNLRRDPAIHRRARKYTKLLFCESKSHSAQADELFSSLFFRATGLSIPRRFLCCSTRVRTPRANTSKTSKQSNWNSTPKFLIFTNCALAPVE